METKGGKLPIIFLNKDTNTREKLITAYHELGHHFISSKEDRKFEEVIGDELKAWLWARAALEKDGYFELREFRNNFRESVLGHLNHLRDKFPTPVGWLDTLRKIMVRRKL